MVSSTSGDVSAGAHVGSSVSGSKQQGKHCCEMVNPHARLADAVHQRHQVLVADRVQRRDDQLPKLGALLCYRVLPHRHLSQQRSCWVPPSTGLRSIFREYVFGHESNIRTKQ